jgi:outer membrane protein assembly factor BamB
MQAGLHAENWPRFRGPTGQGISSETNLPLHWNSASNLAWKAELPGLGWSSPIVWNDHVFVTTVTDSSTRCRVLALDRRTGQMRWNREVFEMVPRRKEGKNSYASPTPVTDGERVYAVFGDGSMAALAFDGAIVWTNRDVQHYSRHGLGASPLVHEGRLIMPFDGSNPVTVPGQYPNNSAEEKLGWQTPWDRAFIAALDTRTGQRIWTARRGLSRVAHVTPNLLGAGPDAQLISAAGDVIQGHDPRTGERIWTVSSPGEGVTPSFAMGDGLIFTASGFGHTTLRTVQTGGRGDVTATHIAWEQRRGTPTQASLLYVKPYLYGITDGGIAHCYAATTGEVIYQERIGGNFCASPVYADGRIYFLSEQGETTVISAGAKFQVLARNPLNEKCQASMAVAQGHLFIRTENSLYCVGAN